MPPALGSAFFLGGLLGAPEAASFVCSALSSREPWMRRGKDGEEQRAPAVDDFAKGADGRDIWSDAFTVAHALRLYETARNGKNFCAGKGLILPVMQQMSSARLLLGHRPVQSSRQLVRSKGKLGQNFASLRGNLQEQRVAG